MPLTPDTSPPTGTTPRPSSDGGSPRSSAGASRSGADGDTGRWKLEALSTVLCATGAVTGWLLAGPASLPDLAPLAFGIAYVAGGWDATRRAARALARGGLDVDLLMLLAAGGAATVDHWLEGAILLFLFSLGNTLETYAFQRTRRSIRGLMALRPDTACRLTPPGEGGEETVNVEELAPGDVVRIRPGERIPVDGGVLEGRSHVDESTLTGEPIPVAKESGDFVYAGTLNEGGSLDVRVEREAHETTLARVIRHVEQARAARAPVQSWIEDVEGRYAAAVIVTTGVAVLLPVSVLGWSWGDAFYRAMTLLVVASPCALVISIPATVVSAVSNGARHGILFKGGAALDAIADVEAVALDKTGTVTRGAPELLAVRALRSLERIGAPSGASSHREPGPTGDSGPDPADELLRLVAAVESRSEHPLAAAVVRGAGVRGLAVPEPEGFRAVSGRGVEALVEGRRIAVGRREWVEAVVGEPVPVEAERWLTLREDLRAATPVFAASDGRHVGVLALADLPRDRVTETLEALRATGVRHVAMLTGDDARTAGAIASQVGIRDVRASLLPEEKARALEEIRARWGRVAMVGDGVNDAPGLAGADVGVAVGAAGTDVAIETADIVIMGEDLSGLVYARTLGRRARRVVRQNLFFAAGVLVALVALALSGSIGLTAGVVGHEGSTIVVVVNGLRLLRGGPGT